MPKEKAYTADDIKALSTRDHVRLRTQIFFGNMQKTSFEIPILSDMSKLRFASVEMVPAAYTAIGEVIDNSLDEFNKIKSKMKLLKIDARPATGYYCISDNGRGIPIEKRKEPIENTKPIQYETIWIPQLALSRLRSGRNFTTDKELGVKGQNGVGAACTNFCSSDFEVTVRRDLKKYHQKFTNGTNNISDPKVSNDASGRSGTEIAFQLDPQVFKDVSMPEILTKNRAIEIALLNPEVTVEYNGEKYRFKKGLAEYIEAVCKDDYYVFTVNYEHIEGEFYVLPMESSKSESEVVCTWANGSYLFDGGKCTTQFLNAFFDNVISHLDKAAKKQKCEVTRADVRSDLVIFANVRLKDPEYDNQAKTRLVGPDLRKEIAGAVEEQFRSFAKKRSAWLDAVLDRAAARHHRDSNNKAADEHKKNFKKHVEGLLDATSKIRSECKILITEGLSAKSKISESRDPRTTAAFALSGKINNTHGMTAAQILKMGKLQQLLAAIRLVPGKRAVRSDLHYGQIIIATDADYDGDDIFTLLVRLFYHWPELFDPKYQPVVYRLVAPNICLVKGKQRIHFPRRAEYEKVKDKYKGYEVRYYKGLGSMVAEDWELILSGETDTLIPILDDGRLEQTLELLFGEDAEARKKWLTNDYATRT